MGTADLNPSLVAMAPKTPRTCQKHGRYQEKGRTSPKAREAGKSPQRDLRSKLVSPQHQGPRMNPGDNQSATKHSQSSDYQPLSASSASPVPRQASSMKPWLSRPFMPDRVEVKKLLMTISSSDTNFIKHIHWSDSSNIFLVEYKGQERILKVVCFNLNITFHWAYQKF